MDGGDEGFGDGGEMMKRSSKGGVQRARSKINYPQISRFDRKCYSFIPVSTAFAFSNAFAL